jgi:putative ABC transport system substrate-binding protein
VAAGGARTAAAARAAVGVLIAQGETTTVAKAYVAAFQQGLVRRAWAIGRDLTIDQRFAVADEVSARTATAELLRLGSEVILAHAVAAVEAARQATRTLPVVFVGISEPITRGFVASLARPGGNLTGFTNIEPSIAGRLVELIKQIAPRTTRVAFPFSLANDPMTSLFYRSVEMATAQLVLSSFRIQVQEPAELDTAIAKLGSEPGNSLLVAPDVFLSVNYQRIAELAVRHRVPAIYALPFAMSAGGLMHYGPDVTDQFRRAAEYVDRILRGEKPADLPVQQPTKFNLVINLKTARALGLEVPPTLLATADEVIE